MMLSTRIALKQSNTPPDRRAPFAAGSGLQLRRVNNIEDVLQDPHPQ